MDEKDPTLIGTVLTWVGLAIAGLGSWVFTVTMGRIKTLEEHKLGKKEFADHVQDVKEWRKEFRDDQARLFEKIDEIKDMMNERRRSET